MEALVAILTRRSIRDYTRQPVPAEIIHELLLAGMSAPSSKDSRPWHFIILEDRRTLNRVPLYFPYAFMIRRAPVAIVVCGDQSLSVFGEYWTFDCAAASQNIVLAAHARGLGACWCGAYKAAVAQEVSFEAWLGLPANIIPFAIIPIGYPAETKPKIDRFDSAKVHTKRW
jgi:nitroreductase